MEFFLLINFQLILKNHLGNCKCYVKKYISKIFKIIIQIDSEK